MALIFVALVLFVILGVAALAVDLGMLLGARTEAQRVADAAALAGAGVLTGAPDDVNVATDMAIAYAAKNDIRGLAAQVLAEDVEVDTAARQVRVRVFRTAERGSALSNIFARAIGIETSDVSTMAAARRAPAGGANCLLPFVLPDRWWEETSEGSSETGPFPEPEEMFNPELNDTYVPLAEYNAEGEIIAGPFEPHSGYDDHARGTEIRLKSGDPHGTWGPAIYFPIRFPGQQPGGDAYRERIRSCPDPDTVWFPGVEVGPEPGDMKGPTKQGFNDLLALAPEHEWRTSGEDVPAGGCVWDPNREGGAGCIPAWMSPRTRVVPLFDPREYPPNPSDDFRISSFAGLFADRVEGNDVYAIFVEYRGAEAMPPGTEVTPLGWTLQLVE